MSRPPRIEFPGAIYHVTSRGDGRKPTFKDDTDRESWLATLAQALQRFDAEVLAYCLMGDHYQLVLHTRQANLSLLMRHLNAVYTQCFNRRHGTAGALFQGRFKAVLVDREAYLIRLCPYVELTPVREGWVDTVDAWPWSSHAAHTGRVEAPPWLDTPGLHGYLLQRPAVTAADRRVAARRYAKVLHDAQGIDLWADGLRQQIYLGDADFAERMQALAKPPRPAKRGVPKARRSAENSLTAWLRSAPTREEALYRAHTEGGLSMTAMARELGLSVSRISRLIAKAEQAR